MVMHQSRSSTDGVCKAHIVGTHLTHISIENFNFRVMD